MRRAVFALLCLFLAAAPAAAEQKLKLRGIKGDDDRLRVSSRDAPWRAIGRVNKRIGGFSTGTLIHPRVVLTAAHCLWNPRTRRFLPPVSLIFVAGYRGGEWLAHSPAARLVVAPGWDVKSARSGHTLQHDWALVELAKPIGAGIAPLPLAADAPLEAPHTQAGYSQDKAHVLTVHRDCRMLGETNPDFSPEVCRWYLRGLVYSV